MTKLEYTQDLERQLSTARVRIAELEAEVKTLKAEVKTLKARSCASCLHDDYCPLSIDNVYPMGLDDDVYSAATLLADSMAVNKKRWDKRSPNFGCNRWAERGGE